jgi:hypothetical protein
MKLLIVCYDLKDGATEDYAAVLSRIKDAGPCEKLGESTYAILTRIEPDHLRAAIALAAPTVNKVYIGALAAPASFFGLSTDANWWLKAALNY